MVRRPLILGLLLVTLSGWGQGMPAALAWKAWSWDVSHGSPVGSSTPGQIRSDRDAVAVDADGALHLKIVARDGAFAGAELVSREKNGFGTYTWDIEAPWASVESCVVLGLGLYGPAVSVGVDGENEIDVEFSRWSSEVPDGDNASFTVFPPTGQIMPGSTPSYDGGLNLDLKTFSRIRVVLDWDARAVQVRFLSPRGKVLDSRTYRPDAPAGVIPQEPLPFMMSLWAFGFTPSQELDVVIRDLTFVPRR